MSVLANTTIQTIFAQSVNGQANTKLVGNEVPVGAIVQAMDVYVNAVSATGGTTGSFVYYMAIVRSGQASAFPQANFTAIGLSKVRNQIFKSEMIMIGSEDGTILRAKFRQKIPKVYQRIRDGDQLVILYEASLAVEVSIGVRYYYKQ